MAVNPNTNFTAGAVLTADQQNRFPRGVMGYAIGAGNSAVSGTVGDVSGMSITFTAVTDRLYKATFSCTLDQNSTATGAFFITDGANSAQARYDNLAVAGQSIVTFSNLFTVSAGSVTRKVRASISAGAATILRTAGSYNYSFIIEDMGPV